MLRQLSVVVLIVPLFWTQASGQADVGPPPYVPPQDVASNASSFSGASASQLLSLTPINAPMFGQLGPGFTQSTLSSFLPIPTDIAGSSSSLSVLSTSLTGSSSTSSKGSTSSTTSTVLASGVPKTSITSESSTGTSSTAFAFSISFANVTISTVPVSSSNNTAAATLSTQTQTVVAVPETTTVNETTSPSQAESGTPTASGTPPIVVSINVPVEVTETLRAEASPSTASPVVVSTVSLLLNSLAPSSVSSSAPATGLAVSGSSTPPVASTVVVSLPAGQPVATSSVTSLRPGLPLTTEAPESCVATTVLVTKTVTVFETATETCPTPVATTPSTQPTGNVAPPSTVVLSSLSEPSKAASATFEATSEASEACSASGTDNSTGCEPGISKLFGPIVVDVLVEASPSTFSTVTIYTTSGFITQNLGAATTSGAFPEIPALCSTNPSGDFVCNGCPTNLFGVTCAYVCTVVGSEDAGSFCEQTNMTGVVSQDEGVIECVPCSSISSTLTFGPTEPIVKGVTGAPEATVTFTQTPTGAIVSVQTIASVSQQDFLSAANSPPVYGAPATTSSPALDTTTSPRSSFTLVALSSPPVPPIEETVAASTGVMVVTTAAVASASLPASTVVMSLPQLSTGVNTATAFSSLVVAASSVPRSPQAATTVGGGSSGGGAEGGSCTSVAAGTRPSPAYTDQQNGMLYRIQCGTTLDLVLQCPYLCSEGGGGLFRQCEDNDQSGPAPTAGGVGIVCQKCLPPCGSSAKRDTGMATEHITSDGGHDMAQDDMMRFFRGEPLLDVAARSQKSLYESHRQDLTLSKVTRLWSGAVSLETEAPLSLPVEYRPSSSKKKLVPHAAASIEGVEMGSEGRLASQDDSLSTQTHDKVFWGIRGWLAKKMVGSSMIGAYGENTAGSEQVQPRQICYECGHIYDSAEQDEVASKDEDTMQ